MSQAGYVRGSTGPGGGYELAMKPDQIRLVDVVNCFEVKNQIMQCPFGEGWCGHNDPCPMHDDIEEMTKDMENFLTSNHFGQFAQPGYSSKRSDQGKL